MVHIRFRFEGCSIMTDRLWDFMVDTMMRAFMPLVCSYYALSASVFLNVSVKDASGMEWLAGRLLSPVQYIFGGDEAIQREDGSWKFVQRHDYNDRFWLRSAACLISLPPSIVLGTAAKGLSLLEHKPKERYLSIVQAKESKEVNSHIPDYQRMGIELSQVPEFLTPMGCKRRPGDENVLAAEKEALREITNVFNEAGIPWWVDCGTLLGAYRYGGVIPWDEDIDVAVLLPDFENVCHALNRLGRDKYLVQDWSTRDHPKSFIKVYIRKTGTMIDIYHFEILQESRELQYVFSLENHLFFPEWWKVRERRFKPAVAFETVFPLKKSHFDGVEVFVPHDTKKYLQRCYGENLDPVKVYNPDTCQYERDLSHPYWQRAFVH
jgi:hypothetical protein